MPRRSAGLILYRAAGAGTEVLLAHPGGPFWATRDAGSWSIPKGEHAADEDPLAAALREFREETGTAAPDGPVLDLGDARQGSGKIVRAFAVAGDLDPAGIRSNTVEIAWPPRSGRTLTVPEIDRAAWFGLAEAGGRILAGQRVFLERLDLALARADQPLARSGGAAPST